MKEKEPNQKKVFFATSFPEFYGSTKSLWLLIENLDRNQWEPIIFCPEEGDLQKAAREEGIESHSLPRDIIEHRKKQIGRLIYVMRMVKLLRRVKPDLVYVNTIPFSTPVWAAKLLRIPVLTHVREVGEIYYNYPDIIGKLRLYALLHFTEKVICVSEAAKEKVLAKKVPGKKVSVIYNGVDTALFSDFKSERCIVREQLSIPEDAVVAAIVGRISAGKGTDVFVEAAGKVAEKAADAYFLVVGGVLNSPYHLYIQSLCEKLSIDDRVKFTGYVEDIRKYYSACDIVVNCSTYEAFPRATLEAMSMQKPVLATKTGGNVESVFNGETGFLFDIGDSEGLAQLLLKLIKEPWLRESLGTQGGERVRNLFTLEKYKSSVIEVMEELIDR